MDWLRRLFGLGARPANPGEGGELTRRQFELLSRQALHLKRREGGAFTRLGGLPRLPAAFDWPQWNGKPLAFLAQIALAEVHEALPSYLPRVGCLYFFYSQDQEAWGFDPKQAGAWRVLYATADVATFREREAPPGLDERSISRAIPVIPNVISLPPDSQRLGAEFDDRAVSDYEQRRIAVFAGQPRHQMLGYPSPVQNDTMELECQLASHGIYVGDAEGYRDPRVPALEAGAADWRLLLQLDSDDEAGWMWGDAGMLYFWIREDDARREDFAKAWMVLQCC